MVFNGYSMVWICLLCLHSTAPVLSVFEALAGTQSALQWPGFPPNLPASQPTEPKLLLLLDRVGQPVSAGNEEICKPSGSANVNKILIRFNQIQTHSSWGRLESFILIHIFVWLCLKIGYPRIPKDHIVFPHFLTWFVLLGVNPHFQRNGNSWIFAYIGG